MKRIAGVVLLLVTGCAASWREDAQSTFATDTGCSDSAAIHRPDISKPGVEPGTYVAIEVIGCHRDIVYMCQGFPAGDQCVAKPDWCTGVGCTRNVEVVAGRAFAAANSCPLERLSATRRADSAQPPADVAADPERLSMWQSSQARRDAATGDVIVRGCGSAASYHCVVQAPAEPACSPI
ncbi:MAG TPA: hypothetical protein VGL61_22280 [Kofleriaceae bacterium]|jgi:hypothetical protein